MGFSKQVGIHAGVTGADAKSPVTQFLEDGDRPKVPARPRERGISIHVFGIGSRSGIQEELNCFFGAEGGGAVQRGFPPGATVPHEPSGLNGRFGGAIGIRPRSQQNSDDLGVGEAIRSA